MDLHSRIKREIKTIQCMLEIYCKNNCNSAKQHSLCDSCQELLIYAEKRLKICPFTYHKTTCGKCEIHCYNNIMKDKVKNVMRFSGPRMILHHPILALRHLLDGRKKYVALKSPTIKSDRR